MSERIEVLGDTYTLLATSEQTNDAYVTVHAVVPPGHGPPPHVHRHQEESFYVLSGEMTFWLDGQARRAGAGEFVRIPPGRPHCFKNESDSDVTMLFTVVPAARIDEFFRAISGPPDIPRVLELAPQYDMEILT